MDAYVIHDRLGTVVSIAMINPDKQLNLQRIPPAGCTVTQVTLPKTIDSQDAAAIDALVREHRIDIEGRKLVPIKY
jgi:hypothetical protein